MSVEPIGFLPPAPPQAQAARALGPDVAAASGASPFASVFERGIAEVNTQLVGAQREVQALARGETASLHQTMIRIEESKLAFQLMVQVRNKLLEAYHDIMRMQV